MVQDLLALSNRIGIKGSTCSLEFSGIITRVGRAVSDVALGDRVVAMVPNKFDTYAIVPEWVCCKLNDDDFTVCLTSS